MFDLSSFLTFLAIAVGAVASALVILNQLFGSEGLLSTGWNKRERALRVLRGKYPSFDEIYRKVDSYKPKGTRAIVVIILAAVIPQASTFVFLALPFLKQPLNTTLYVLAVGGSFWFSSTWIAGQAGKYEHLGRPMSDRETLNLTRLRYIQGRMVLVWLNIPVLTVSLSIVNLTSPITATAESSVLAIGAAILFSVLFGLATIQSLSAIGGATYADFKLRTSTIPKVRLSLKGSAGGPHTLTGTLLEIGTECVLQTDDRFVEHVDWQHLGRLSVEA
jgi:hypothetical protein